MAFQWQSGTGLDSVKKRRLISDSFNRSLASIEASDRLNDLERTLYYSSLGVASQLFK